MMQTLRLTIRGVRARAVSVSMTRPIQTSSGPISTTPLVLIDLFTEEGVTGTSYVFCYTPLALKPVAHLTANLEPLIKGDTVAPVAIEQKLQKHFRLLGPQGLTGMAMAGIDMAAWDALARAAGLPLVRLLGGEPGKVPAYGSLRSMAARDAAREAAEAAEAGFQAVKVKVGHATVQGDLDVVREIRQAAGGEVSVMVDYNQSLTVPEGGSLRPRDRTGVGRGGREPVPGGVSGAWPSTARQGDSFNAGKDTSTP